MARNAFDEELGRLRKDLVEMGARVEQAMDTALSALRTMDREAARQAVKSDDEIDAMEHRLEQACMTLIARQQPIARDLRVIAATLKILTDMERVGDQCADICEMVLTMEKPLPQAVEAIAPMFGKAKEMFSRAINSYISSDVELARAVCAEDDAVDEAFSHNILMLCGSITDNPTVVPQAVDYMFVTKYIERMGDHATNIAEWTIYMATGEHPDLNRHELKDQQ